MAKNHILIVILCQLLIAIITSEGRPSTKIVSSGILKNTPTASGSIATALNCSQDNAQLQLLTTAVSEMELAKQFARDLVQQQLAAIVNIMPMESAVYMWDGQLVEESEILLLIYSQECQLQNLEEYIRENHPDEEPGLAALPIVGGSTSFLEWIKNNSRPANDTSKLIV